MKRYISIILLSISVNAFAQQEGDKDIKAHTIEVTKDYKPLLTDANKTTLEAAMPKFDTAKIKLNYSLLPSLLTLPYIPAELKPVAMTKEDDASVLQNNYVKLGFGTQLSPYADAHFSNGRNDKIYYAINAFHNSSHGSNVQYKNFSDNKLNGDVRFQFKKTTLGVYAGYTSNTIYYYGYNHSDSALKSLTKSDLRQRYNLADAGLWLQNAIATKAGIDYKLTFDEKYFYTLKKDNENEVEAGVVFSKKYEKIHSFNLVMGIDNISFKDSSFSGSTTLVPFHPYYEYRNGIYYGRVGFVLTFANPLLFYPDIYGEAHLLDGHITPYANIGGFTDKNLAMNLTQINPYLGHNIPTAIGKSIILRGGVKGSFADHFVYDAALSYRIYDYLPIYNYTDTNGVTRYLINYQLQAGEFNPHAEIGYRQGEKITITLRGDYYKYRLDFQLPAYGYPTWKLTLHANYDIQGKILIGLDLFSTSNITQHFEASGSEIALGNGVVKATRDITRNVSGWLDANLSITYNYKKNFGAFIMLNNFGATPYAPWYNYDTYGLMFKAGVLLKF